jgi:hypothetical protein
MSKEPGQLAYEAWSQRVGELWSFADIPAEGQAHWAAVEAAVRADATREMVEALEPFARLAGKYDPPEGDDDHTTWCQTALPTLGDLRRARAALEKARVKS